MKERLIELIKEKARITHRRNSNYFVSEVNVGDIADYLLANGVIVLPCKVGDTVYMICHKYTKSWQS